MPENKFETPEQSGALWPDHQAKAEGKPSADVHVFTHMNVDLDAVASSWFALRFIKPSAELCFVPANWDGSTLGEHDLAVDIDAAGRGIKGVKEPDTGIVHSCLATLVAQHASAEDQRALAELVRFVDAQDTGNAIKNLGVTEKEAVRVLSFTSLNAVLRALQGTFPHNDQKVCERMFEIFDGMLKSGRSRIAAEREAESATWFRTGVAIIRNARHMGTNGVLMEQGAKVVVFVDGNNLGVVRRDDVSLRMDHPAIKAVVATESGWFFHPAGFLAARGTRKAPVQTPSTINPESLALVVNDLLENISGRNEVEGQK